MCIIVNLGLGFQNGQEQSYSVTFYFYFFYGTLANQGRKFMFQMIFCGGIKIENMKASHFHMFSRFSKGRR
jgi:hypothetical protein